MKINNETKIGVMVVFVLALLGAMSYKAGSFNLKKEGYNIRVRFNDIDGVNLNSPVMFNGFEVGIVDDISIVDDNGKTKMELLLWIDSKARLRAGAKAYIKNLGFMGEKYVGLVSSQNKADFLRENSLIVGEEPPKFDDLLTKGNDIASEVKEVVANINERLKTNSHEVDEILKNTNQTMKNISSATDNLDGILEKNKSEIDSMISNLSALSLNLEEMSYDLKLHPWKILYKSKDKNNTDNKDGKEEK